MCCDNLEEPLTLMKMGLSVILVGHVNFLLGALVHGIVLRHINLHEKARGMGYAISNVVTLISGMLVSVELILQRGSIKCPSWDIICCVGIFPTFICQLLFSFFHFRFYLRFTSWTLVFNFALFFFTDHNNLFLLKHFYNSSKIFQGKSQKKNSHF